MNTSIPEALQILVVDDDDQMLKTIGDILRMRGYQPVASTTGARALQLARETDPLAVALVDLRLPDMDGIELVSRLRSVSEITQVVILTGNASVDSAVRAMREHSYDYLVKPVHPQQLLDSIGRAGERWQRQRAELQLRESEDRLRRIFDHTHDALFITDEQDRIVDANRTALEFVGMDLGALSSWALGDLLIPGPRGHHGMDATGLRQGEWLLNNARGEPLIVDVRGAAFAPQRFVYTVRDMTEQRRLEEELHHSQKMDAIGRLAGGVAHDFNNMLTAISCYSEMLRDEFEPGDQRREDLDEIVKTTRRAAALTSQLLAFSRKQVLQPKVLNANTVVMEIQRMLGRLIGEDIRLMVQPDPNLWSVRADPGQLGQVLMNLAVNARDAMPDGGTLTIETANLELQHAIVHRHGTVPPGSYVVIRVSDTGTGIEDHVQEHVFDPFFTTKQTGRGTGLGLSTVYGIITQSGGHIQLQSAPGEGATFTIFLPRELDVEPEAPAPAEPERHSASTRATILVVEDDPTVRKLVTGILQRNGHTVLTATDGASALAIVGTSPEPIQLAIMDVVMPGMNGREVSERLAQLSPDLKVLFMSGYTDDDVIHRGVRDLTRRFIQKPFTAAELIQKVDEVLNNRAERR
jgi:PAS domain S-box-containing protein